jgi:hypothetical protein
MTVSKEFSRDGEQQIVRGFEARDVNQNPRVPQAPTGPIQQGRLPAAGAAQQEQGSALA